MNLKAFLKTLKSYGYSTEYAAQILNTLVKIYTEYTYNRRIPPSRDVRLFAVFRLLHNADHTFEFTSEGLKIAEELITERARSISKDMCNPEAFFVLKFMHPYLEEPEIQFLLSSGFSDMYERTMEFLVKSGLAFADGTKAPRNLHTFFEFPFKEEPFEKALQKIRAYLRLSSFNQRIMRVTFSDMQGCKEEVQNAVKDMRAQGIIKEFLRDKGYSFRVLDKQGYSHYIQDLLNGAIHDLRFVPPPSEYTPPVHCGWDSVGLLDEYPVSEETPMNILLFGDPGPLKQLWSQHYLYGELLNGKGGIYLSLNSPPEDIRKNFVRFNKDITAFEEKPDLIFLDCYPRREKPRKYYTPIGTSSLTDFATTITEAFQEIQLDQGVIVFDSLSNLMLYFDPEQVIKFAVNQASRLKEWGWTGVFIVEKGVNDEKIENSLKFLLDGVFEIEKSEFRILWIRGMVDKPVAYAVDISRRGLILLPKREYHG